MSETPEQQLEATLKREQEHFESLMKPTDLDELKSKILQGVEEQAQTNTRQTTTKSPTWFAIAATVVLSVSLLLYSQLNTGRLELLTHADINSENQFLSSMTEIQILSLEAIPMSTNPNDPIIDLEQPKELKNLENPFKLKLLFHASPGSEIVIDSFMLTYGLSKIDITERVLENAKIGSDQLAIKKLTLPSGIHYLRATVEDTKGRKSETLFKLDVN